MTEKCNFTISIEAALLSKWETPIELDDDNNPVTPDPDAPPVEPIRKLLLTDPTFRYTFLSDKRRVKETTGKIGVAAGEGWSELQLSSSDEIEKKQRRMARQTDMGQSLSNLSLLKGRGPEAEAQGEEGDEDEVEEEEDEDEDGEAKVLVFEKKHPVSFDENNLLDFNDFPFVSFTLGDNCEENPTAVFPPKPKPKIEDTSASGGEEEVPKEAEEEEDQPKPVGRHFIDTKTFDLSGFFVGETEKSWTWGDKFQTSEEYLCTNNNNSDNENDNDNDNDNDNSNFEATQFNDSSLQDETNTNTNTNTYTNTNNAPSFQPTTPKPPLGLRYLKITIKADKPILTGANIEKWNPVRLEIRNVKDLPGVRVTALADKHFVEPTRFKLLDKHCYPCYSIVRMFVGDRVICPRVVRTNEANHAETTNWNHVTSYLTGHIDRQLLEESIENLPFTVELQDRQPIPKQKELDAEAEKWERMLVGGFSLEEEEKNKDKDKDKGEEDKKKEDKKKGKNQNQGNEGGPQLTQPLDIFDVDALRMIASHEGWKTAGDSCSHGIASCSMKPLLDQSTQLAAAYSKNYTDKPTVNVPKIKCRLNILQEKRRTIPKGGLDEWDLTEGERLVRKTGNYLNDGDMDIWANCTRTRESSTFGVTCNFANSLRTLQEGASQRTGPPDPIIFRPFTRAVYTFEYKAVQQLQSLNKAIDRVNDKALRETMIGSLMSYQLSEEEVTRANSGELNLICGCMVIDDDCRMVFIEGTVDGMASVLAECKRMHQNDWSCRVLSNPDIRFKERIYTEFNVDLKKIRLREPLPMLNEMPEIYNRAKVSQDCFEALHRLGLIRHANRLDEASNLQMFPTAPMVIQVESKYGESISMEDILGVRPKKKIRSWDVKEEVFVEEDEVIAEEKVVVKRNADTDDKNPEFDKYLSTRTSKDFLKEQAELLEEAKEEGLKRIAARDAADALEDPVRFVYSTQKLAYTEIKKEHMRNRLSKAKNCTFTYSQQFTSQTVSMVDGERLKQVEAEESKKAWKTSKGFVYPAPRKSSEYAVHPNKPSQSRIEILTEEWIENELHPENVKREIELKEGQPDFNTVPSNGKMIFGGLEAPKFTREFVSNNIGSHTQLPRGKIINDVNNKFFNSVHLCGEGLFVEEQAEKKKAEEEWRAKVCVDSLDFLVGGFVEKDKTDPVDRVKDILDGPALKKSLKIVRNAKLPSGKRVPLRPAPFSMFQDAFEDPKDFTEDLRPNDATTYLAKNETTGMGEDFYRYIHNDSGKPKSQTFIAKRKAAPLDYTRPEIANDPRFTTGH